MRVRFANPKIVFCSNKLRKTILSNCRKKQPHSHVDKMFHNKKAPHIYCEALGVGDIRFELMTLPM